MTPGMTAPRQLLKGSTYLVSRRCVERKYLLRPGKVTTQVLGYLVAVAAALFGIKVHAYCAMSNHLHLVVTDPDARLPEFLRHLDGLAAKAINALYGRKGYFWDDEEFNATLLDSPEDIFDRLVYVLANPVSAGLVRKGRQWPGLWSAPEDMGKTLEFPRPGHYFNPEGQTPKLARLKLEIPAGLGPEEALRGRLTAALAAREQEESRRRMSVLGVARVLKQRVLDFPATKERSGSLKPRFAARDIGKRIELAIRLKTFLAEYREALLAWREMRSGVVFPEGTYLMRVAHGVRCAGAG